MRTPRPLASIRVPFSTRRSLRISLGVTQRDSRTEGMNDLIRREAPWRTFRLGRLYVAINLRPLDTNQDGHRVSPEALIAYDDEMRAAEADAAAMVARMKARGTI